MFIGFVSKKGHRNHNKAKKKINGFKPACIGLAVFFLASFVTRIWNFAIGEGKIYDFIADGMVWFYRQAVLVQYNISAYDAYADEKNNSGMEQLISVINDHNSLYGYMKDNGMETSLCQADPMYNYADVSALDENTSVNENSENKDEQNGEHEDTENQNIEIQNQNKEEPAEEAVNTAKHGEESQEQSANDEDVMSDYVVPTVAEVGVTYTMEELSDFDFLMSKLYTVPDRALVYESDLVAEEMLKKDMTIQGDNSAPQILIYHTHSQEGFTDSVAGDDTTNIVAVGAYLAQILSEEYGYNVIHCQEHFDIAGGSLDRSKAYTYAQYTIEQILEDNPTIDVILDIHRDGLPEGADKLVTNINGKDTAKIMFFNGVSRSSSSGEIDYLYNRYRADNLAFSFQLKLMAMECYPEFTRKNYVDAYQYNLHHRQKSVLVEVGAQNNTLQEELNAMEVLAEILHRVISPDSGEADS